MANRTAAQDFFTASNVLFEGRSADRVALDLWVGASSRIATADFCKLEKGICDGNLGIPRIKMPQIPENKMDDFVKFLKGEGFRASKKKIPVDKLKATQKEIKAEKAEAISKAIEKGTMKDHPIIVSSDNHILDGHHRWAGGLLAKVRKGLNVMFNAIQVNIPIRKLLDFAHGFEGTEYRDLNDGARTARLRTAASRENILEIFPEVTTEDRWDSAWNLHAREILESGLFTGTLKGADLRGLDLSGVDFKAIELASTHFEGSDLRGCSFDRCRLMDCTFTGADLRKASFERASMVGVRLEDCDARKVNLSGAIIQYGSFEGTDFTGAMMIKTYLKDVKTNLSTLRNINMSGANLIGIDVSKAKVIEGIKTDRKTKVTHPMSKMMILETGEKYPTKTMLYR